MFELTAFLKKYEAKALSKHDLNDLVERKLEILLRAHKQRLVLESRFVYSLHAIGCRLE